MIECVIQITGKSTIGKCCQLIVSCCIYIKVKFQNKDWGILCSSVNVSLTILPSFLLSQMAHLWLIHISPTSIAEKACLFISVLSNTSLKKYILKTNKYKFSFLEDQVTLFTRKKKDFRTGLQQVLKFSISVPSISATQQKNLTRVPYWICKQKYLGCQTLTVVCFNE